ncbi:MAG: ArsR/SmtB family transcription factor [Candidatus Hadarchaeia archaeon]
MSKKRNDRIYEKHADLCKMLANPTRLEIIDELTEGEKSVGDLVSSIEIRQANLSQHLAEMRKRNLLETRKEGAKVYYSLAFPEIVDACNLIQKILFKQLSREKKLLEGGEENEK